MSFPPHALPFGTRFIHRSQMYGAGIFVMLVLKTCILMSRCKYLDSALEVKLGMCQGRAFTVPG